MNASATAARYRENILPPLWSRSTRSLSTTNRARCCSMPPKLTRGNARAFGHRRHFRPHDIRIDRGLPHPGAVTAVAAGHDVFAADELRVATDPLRDQLR